MRSNANPQGSKRPARAGTAPREGKALKGDSKGRERHETRPRSVGASRQSADPARVRTGRERSQNRREGKNPEDGTGEGLATLAYHDGGASFRRGTPVAPDVNVLSGARTPGEADPVLSDRGRPRKRPSMRTGGGQSRHGRALKRSRTSREGLADVHARRSVSPRKTPEPLERQGGRAGSHEGATRRSRTPLKKTATSRELGRGRVTAHDHRVPG